MLRTSNPSSPKTPSRPEAYAFSAKKGQVFHIEAFADRLGAPMDLFFQLRSAQGTLITEQDDNPEILSPQFYTANTDPPTAPPPCAIV